MPLANTIIMPANMPGATTAAKPRAARFTGEASRRKAIARAATQRGPLTQNPIWEFVTVSLPIRTVNSLNERAHWGKKAARAARERGMTRMYLARLQPLPPLPWLVTLTRIGRGTRQMDDDGLAASLKHIRDEIAACGGVDDGKRELIRFVNEQERGAAYAVAVRIEHRSDNQ